jgi:hypothetical protein
LTVAPQGEQFAEVGSLPGEYSDPAVGETYRRQRTRFLDCQGGRCDVTQVEDRLFLGVGLDVPPGGFPVSIDGDQRRPVTPEHQVGDGRAGGQFDHRVSGQVPQCAGIAGDRRLRAVGGERHPDVEVGHTHIDTAAADRRPGDQIPSRPEATFVPPEQQ